MFLPKFVRLLYSSGMRGRTRITLALARRFKSLQAVPVKLIDGSTLYADLRLMTSHGVFLGWTHDVNEENIFRRLIKPGDVVYDIGAHIGLYSVLFSQLTGRTGKVFSFEPSSEASSALKLTISNLENTTLCPFGLSDKNTESFLFIPQDPSTASLVDWTDHQSGDVHKISCQLKRLDELIESNELPYPNFIKCDVEGAEELVFKGSGQKLNDENAPIILFEVNEKALNEFKLSKTGAMDLLASFDKAKFTFFDARTANLLPITEIPPPLVGALAVNILAVPQSKLSFIK